MEPSPQPKKRQKQLKEQDATEVATGCTAPAAVTVGAETADPVPQRWVVLETTPRLTKQQKRRMRQATTEGSTARLMAHYSTPFLMQFKLESDFVPGIFDEAYTRPASLMNRHKNSLFIFPEWHCKEYVFTPDSSVLYTP